MKIIDAKSMERIKQLEEENILLKQTIVTNAKEANENILKERMKYNILLKEFADIKRRLNLLELLVK